VTWEGAKVGRGKGREDEGGGQSVYEKEGDEERERETYECRMMGFAISEIMSASS
jgi:hypothetical protein